MRPTVSSGDLALAAQPAAAASFAPFGRLLAAGDRSYLGRRGRVLATVDLHRVAPRRVTHLQRYAEARRAIVPMGRAPMWLVVLPPGEAPQEPPSVFLVPEGMGVILKEGVWHAGPVPLTDLTLCELLETHGPADRLDRRPVRQLCKAEAVRVLLAEDPASPAPALDLSAQGTVLLDASLHGRLRLGALLLDRPVLDRTPPQLEAEIGLARQGLRAMWGHVADLREIHGVALVRDLYRDWGLDAGRLVPRSEALIAQVLAGQEVAAAEPLARTLALCALRNPLPMIAVDAHAAGGQVLVRLGGEEDGHLDAEERPVRLEGLPVLCDRDGQPIACPLGEAGAARPGPRTQQVLVLLFLPATVDPASAAGVLEATGRTLETHLGGRVDGRRVAG